MSSNAGKPKIVAIVGPTASGKTALAIKLAKKFGGEIVSADSRQVYRGMNIGTAKPTKKEMAGIPHRLIDNKNPDECYTVAEYKKDAVAAIKKILHRKKLPIIVGGTGLYVKAVLENLEIPAVRADGKLRKKLELELRQNGLSKLFQKLVELDPEAQYIVDPKNHRRVIRALEVAIKTGRPFSAQRKTGKPLFNALMIGIQVPVATLKKRIDARVEEMVRGGLVAEVKKLVKIYGPEQKAFEAIGYREIVDYLNSNITLAEAVGLIKKNTWRYAKRQMTWFKKDRKIHWVTNEKQVFAVISSFIKKSP